MSYRTIALTCPVALIPQCNHLVNCFESVPPTAPVLSTPSDPAVTHVTITPAVRPEFISAITAIAATGVLPTPGSPLAAVMKVHAWNRQTRPFGQEPSPDDPWLVDYVAANYALSMLDIDPVEPAPARITISTT